MASTMRVILSSLICSVLACIGMGHAAAAQIHKCVADGKVSYQADPCPGGAQRQRPTVEQLNRERRQRQPPDPAAAQGGALTRPQLSGASASGAGEAAAAPRTVTTPPASAAPFRCDGRRHCSQMTSCAEAHYFLAHCPGVKMDGDNDGIPCEDQWCH